MEKTACRINGEFGEYFIFAGSVQTLFEFLVRNIKKMNSKLGRVNKWIESYDSNYRKTKKQRVYVFNLNDYPI